MTTENRVQEVNNQDYRLVWTVANGVHTIKLIESTDPEVTTPPTMVRPQTTKVTFTHTEE